MTAATAPRLHRLRCRLWPFLLSIPWGWLVVERQRATVQTPRWSWWGFASYPRIPLRRGYVYVVSIGPLVAAWHFGRRAGGATLRLRELWLSLQLRFLVAWCRILLRGLIWLRKI